MSNNITEPQLDESFRDSIATVDDQGKRIWIYPKKPKGRYYNARGIVSAFLLAFLFIAPWIKVGGEQLLQFDILHRKFIVFGTVFMPQDLHLFVLFMITLIIFIVLFTVVYGRLFCGWACPQTIFMEMVFRKIEYWIEGDANKQRKLNKAPWTRDKIVKKVSKMAIFYTIAFLIANTFLSYIVGIDKMKTLVTHPPMENMWLFVGVVLFSGAFFFVFTYMREQVCTTVCPYGRFQGVLLDQDSIVVAYDFVRGEPRGKKRRGQEQKELGDCIDCKLCVQVCPTGIDIRSGTQLECVNCTACMDACDEVMDKIERPKGLIRYASHNQILEQREKIKFTPRMMGYSTVLLVLIGVIGFLLKGRADMETTVLRAPGVLYQEIGEDSVSNLYNIHIVNKAIDEATAVEVRVLEPAGGAVEVIGKQMILEKEDMDKRPMFIKYPKSIMNERKNKVVVGVYNTEGELLDKATVTFMAPIR